MPDSERETFKPSTESGSFTDDTPQPRWFSDEVLFSINGFDYTINALQHASEDDEFGGEYTRELEEAAGTLDVEVDCTNEGIEVINAGEQAMRWNITPVDDNFLFRFWE